MPWVKLDDHFDEHPKVATIGPLGVALQVAALCYSNRNLTDGFIPRSAARRLVDFDGLAFVSATNDVGFGSGEDVTAKLVIEQMLVASVWVEVQGGYQIHNYAKYQPTREQVEAEREQKKTAGHLGGVASALAAAQARAAADAKHAPKRKPSTRRGNRSSRTAAEPQAESKPVPVPEPLVGEGEGTGTRGGSGGNDSPSPTTAASPAGSSQAAADLAAEPHNPAGQQLSSNGARCRHGNDTTTCGVCSAAVGTPPSAAARAELDAVRARNRRGSDTNATETREETDAKSARSVHELDAPTTSSEPEVSAK